MPQLLERCQREDAVEQARQSQVDEEKAHPGEPGFRDAELQLAADEAEKDQPEERQSEVEDVEHAGLIVPDRPPNAKKAGRDNLTRSSGHAASADLPRSMMVHQRVRSTDAYKLHHATILVREHVAMKNVGAREINKSVADFHVARILCLAGGRVEQYLSGVCWIGLRSWNRNNVLPYEAFARFVRLLWNIWIVHFDHLERINMYMKRMSDTAC